jgi:transcriptional regulator with XRE-family HTH domain
MTGVNTLYTMDTPPPETPGQRLRALVDARWSRRQGGIRGLAARLGVSGETMYSWFRDDQDPSLDHLARLAEALGVRRYEIVAAMDAEGTLYRRGDPDLVAVVEELLDERLDALLDERGVRGRRPRGASPS